MDEELEDLLRSRPSAWLEAVEQLKTELTNSVMSSTTTPEEREEMLREYHAVDRVMNRLRSQTL